MKWLIASDLHGSVPNIEKLMEALKRENADKLLLLGDYLYHGPRNSIPEGYDTILAADVINGNADRILAIRGNCDSDVDQLMLSVPILAENAFVQFGDSFAFATHGHVYNRENPPKLKKGDILLHGHTHVPVCETIENGVILMNPGSVSLPKGGSEHSYMVFEKDTFYWKTLSGETYREFRK